MVDTCLVTGNLTDAGGVGLAGQTIIIKPNNIMTSGPGAILPDEVFVITGAGGSFSGSFVPGLYRMTWWHEYQEYWTAFIVPDMETATLRQVVDGANGIHSVPMPGPKGDDGPVGPVGPSALNPGSSGYANRTGFVTAVAAGDLDDVPDGMVVLAGGLQYIKKVGSTVIPDLSNWEPSGVWEPGHFQTLALYAGAVASALASSRMPENLTLTAGIALQSGARLIGASGKEKITRNGTFNAITGTGRTGVVVRDLIIDSNREVEDTSGHLISLTNVNDAEISGITILNNGNRAGGGGGGTGVLITAVDSDPENKSYRARLLNSTIIGSSTSGINIGWIWDNTDFGRVSGVYVENHLNGLGWAHELKHYSHYNVLSDLQANGANIGFGAGGETWVDTLGASYNIWTGLVGKNVRHGYAQPRGVGNLVNGLVLDGSVPSGDARAEVFSIGVPYSTEGNGAAKQNVFKGIVGFGSRRFANVGGDSNSVEIFAHTTGEMAKFQPGARRNFVFVGHPGLRDSVQTYIDNGSNSIKGADANVVFSPVTGEWIGSVSGYFRITAGESGATWNPSHYFRMESDSNAVLAFGHPGGENTNSGISVSISGDANVAGLWHVTGNTRSADRWGFRGFGQGEVLSLDAAALWPTRDAGDASARDKALGKADRRWKEIFAANGTINTSDAREKTAPLPIDDAVLDAWGDVQLIAFQWLEAVAAKGDLARVHHGVIAQQVRDAFAARGMDATRYAFLCYDEWEALEEIVGEDGEVIQEARPAGSRWGIRADQCLFVEAAYQRRRCDRIESRLAAIGA